jgi:lysophospholipase L1-like esterase
VSHLVLLGDSILDNGAYAAPGPDVVRQVRSRLPPGWSASLLAVDGDVAADVTRNQLSRTPEDASHIVVSAGGNDALRAASVLSERATSMADAVTRLARVQDRFAADYRAMAQAVADRGLPTAVCTIYDANYPQPYRTLVLAALALFNDVIIRTAAMHRLDVIDLRLICTDPADYANPIEPSAQGGDKIAAAINAFAVAGERSGRTVVWT